MNTVVKGVKIISLKITRKILSTKNGGGVFQTQSKNRSAIKAKETDAIARSGCLIMKWILENPIENLR